MAFSKDKLLILFAASLGAFMAAINASIVNIALPSITNYYQAPLSTSEWVLMIYLLLLSSLLLTFGRLGDMYGHKRIYILGFIILTLASLFITQSPSIYYLILFRGIQAIGGSMVIAVIQAIIAANFGPGERGKAIGLNSMFVSLGLALGPAVGGILLSYFYWQALFYINIPVGILGILVGWHFIPEHKGDSQKFDLAGASTLFFGLMSFLLAMSHGQAWGWKSPIIVSLFVSSLIIFTLFIYFEMTREYPMIQLSLFKNRLFTAASGAALLNYLTQYSVIFLIPFYLVDAMEIDPSQAGLIMTSFSLVMMITVPVSGTLADRIGSRTLTASGMGIIALAIYILSTLSQGYNLLTVLLGLGLAGLGTGLFLSPNNNAIMASVPREYMGIGSGMIATMRSLGQVMGVAVSGAVFNSRAAYYTTKLQTSGIDTVLKEKEIFILSLHDAYLVAMIFALLGLLTCLIRGNQETANAS